MKNFKLIIAVLAFSFLTSVSSFAGNNETENSNTKLLSELTSLLGDYYENITDEVNFSVSFMLNNNNEIVVISVNSKVSNMDSFVKSRLNYKKIDVKGIKKGKVYTLPVRIV